MKLFPSIYYLNQEHMASNLSHTAAPIGANPPPAHIHNSQQLAVSHLQKQQQE